MEDSRTNQKEHTLEKQNEINHNGHTRKKPMNLVALFSLASCILIIVSLFFFNNKIDSISQQLDSLKAEQENVNKPILTIEGSFITRDQEFGVLLRNKGGGSAFIKSINARFENKWYRDLCNENKIVELLKDMGVDGLWAEYYCYKTGDSFSNQISMVAGERNFLIRAVKGLYSDEQYLKHCKRLGLSISKLYVEVEYCSKEGLCEWVKRDFAEDDIFLDALPD